MSTVIISDRPDDEVVTTGGELGAGPLGMLKPGGTGTKAELVLVPTGQVHRDRNGSRS